MLIILYVQRWYVDGTVECFVNEHAPLAVSAILVLIFCVLIVVIMAAIVLRKIKVCDNLSLYIVIISLQRHWVFSMSNILKDPFTNNLYWWAPIDLLRRPLFVILITIFPGNLVSVDRHHRMCNVYSIACMHACRLLFFS